MKKDRFHYLIKVEFKLYREKTIFEADIESIMDYELNEKRSRFVTSFIQYGYLFLVFNSKQPNRSE